jgi:hypothetical protein
MVKLMRSISPKERNSHQSNFNVEKYKNHPYKNKISPVDLIIKIIPIGTISKHWDNFNLEHYRRISVLRDEMGTMS